MGAVAFDDTGDGVLAQADFAANQAITASPRDERHHPCGEAVGFWPVPWLAAEALASGLRGGDAGTDALLA